LLNYVWLGLLVLGIGTALTSDIIDQSNDKYRNGDPLPVEIWFEDSISIDVNATYDGKLIVHTNDFNNFYNSNIQDKVDLKAKVTFNKDDNNVSIYFNVENSSPELWKYMAKLSGKEDDLTGNFEIVKRLSKNSFIGKITLEEVAFSNMKDVTNAALDYAGTAVNIALGLIGIMALWLGVMKVAEDAGLIRIIANGVRPITKFLFPDVPSDHPAMGSMIMNIAANMLGLGNAATPFGLKAMEEMDSLNKNKGTATNAMVTFLAVNTAGLTLIPVTAIAIRAASGSSNPAIIIGTSIFGALCATTVGITATKILEKFPIKKGEFASWLNSYKKGLIIFLSLITLTTVLAVSGILTKIFSILSFVNPVFFKTIINIISILAIPV